MERRNVPCKFLSMYFTYFLKINISSELLLSALLQNLFYALCRWYFLSHIPAAVDAMAEEKGDNPAPAPLSSTLQSYYIGNDNFSSIALTKHNHSKVSCF